MKNDNNDADVAKIPVAWWEQDTTMRESMRSVVYVASIVYSVAVPGFAALRMRLAQGQNLKGG